MSHLHWPHRLAHVINSHQITHGSEIFQKEINRCREYSQIYDHNFHSISESNDNDSDSDNDSSSDVDHGKSKAGTTKSRKIKHVVNSSQNTSTTKKIFNPTTKKANESSNLPKSSTPLVRLAGANPTITPSNFEKNTILRYKKLLTKELKKKIRIKETDFKHHYDNTDEIILDF